MADRGGLEDAYSETIERIRPHGGDKVRLGMEALMWISHTERPLRVDELCHAQCSQPSRPDCRALASDSPVCPGRGWYGRPGKASVLDINCRTVG